MTRRFGRSIFLVFILAEVCNCATSEIVPPQPPVPPVYTKVPHPVSMDLRDLSTLFMDPEAPKDPQFSKECGNDFIKLKARTESVTEVKEGVREFVALDPVAYHWCFYRKLLDLESYIKSDAFLDEKQKEVLSTYEFLVPVARSFEKDYHDTRYIRWAMARYQHLSEWVFYRKLELTPAGTLELVQPVNPFGLYKGADRNLASATSVLEKYNLVSPGLPTAPPPIILDIPSPLPLASVTVDLLSVAPDSARPSPVPSTEPVVPVTPVPASSVTPTPTVSAVPSSVPEEDWSPVSP